MAADYRYILSHEGHSNVHCHNSCFFKPWQNTKQKCYSIIYVVIVWRGVHKDEWIQAIIWRLAKCNNMDLLWSVSPWGLDIWIMLYWFGVHSYAGPYGRLVDVNAWRSDSNLMMMWDVITQPRPNVNDYLKPLFHIRHGWLITPHSFKGHVYWSNLQFKCWFILSLLLR